MLEAFLVDISHAIRRPLRCVMDISDRFLQIRAPVSGDQSESGGEEPLRGGNSAIVTRVGDTVRRPTGPWTPAVHLLLREYSLF